MSDKFMFKISVLIMTGTALMILSLIYLGVMMVVR